MLRGETIRMIMENLKKITDLLCNEEDIRKDIIVEEMDEQFSIWSCFVWDIKITYKDLHLHHLLWYCELKNIEYVIYYDCPLFALYMDFTKPPYQQSEKTLEAIYNFLTQ